MNPSSEHQASAHDPTMLGALRLRARPASFLATSSRRRLRTTRPHERHGGDTPLFKGSLFVLANGASVGGLRFHGSRALSAWTGNRRPASALGIGHSSSHSTSHVGATTAFAASTTDPSSRVASGIRAYSTADPREHQEDEGSELHPITAEDLGGGDPGQRRQHNADGAGGGMSRRKLGDVNAADLLRYIDDGALDASKQIALYMLLSHMDAHLERGVQDVGVGSGAGGDDGGGGDGDDASLDADLETRATQREERQACLRLVDALVTSRDYDGSRLIVQMLRRTPSGSTGGSNHGGSAAGSSTAATNGASAVKAIGTHGTIAGTADAGGVNGTTKPTGATGITAGNGVTGANGVTGGARPPRTPKANGATHARAAAEGAAAVAAAEVAATASALTSGVYFASSSASSAASAASASLSAMDALSSLVDAMEDPSGSPPTRPMDDPLAPMDVSFLVNSHLRNGQLRAARLVLQTMRTNAGVVPDRKVYMQVLNAFAGQRNWSGARLVFLDMQESGHWLDSKICTILST